MRPWVNIFWGPGTNCHRETAYAFKLAGGDPHIVLRNRAISGKDTLSDCDLFCLPGGFIDGDHIRSGFIMALDMVNRFRDQMLALMEKKIPILGICNGMQDLAASGLLNGELGRPTVLMDTNESTRFEHWQNEKIVIHHCLGSIWTEGLDGVEMLLPVAHGEGRPVFLNQQANCVIAATYHSYEGDSGYPNSPNGSLIAGLSHGVIFGLMPHPERRVEKRQGGTDGLRIFQNGVNAVK